jgi:alcohol dehydrogenase
MDPGGLAEYVKCPAGQAIPLAPDYPFAEAACLPITFGTAWRMLERFGRIVPGDVVVVLGAGGGVAIAAIQIAKLMGARIIATASTDEKLARAAEFGADETINYVREPEWDTAVRRLTGKRGADVIVETIGATTWEQSIRALGKGGRLVTCGATAGPIGQTDIRYLFRREQTIQGSNGWTHNDLLRLTKLAFAGKLRPVIDRVLPLEQVADGERALERREVFGKVIIDPTQGHAA